MKAKVRTWGCHIPVYSIILQAQDPRVFIHDNMLCQKHKNDGQPDKLGRKNYL